MGGDGIVGKTRQQRVYRVGVGEHIEIGASVLHEGTDQRQFHGRITNRGGDDLVQSSAGEGVKSVLLVEARSFQELDSRLIFEYNKGGSIFKDKMDNMI